jgi:hypothetical protein
MLDTLLKRLSLAVETLAIFSPLTIAPVLGMSPFGHGKE